MSDEYRSNFISNHILNNKFTISEYDNFTAKIEDCDHPVFKWDMKTPWSLQFEVDQNNKLIWTAIEYEDEDDGGTIIRGGTIEVVIKDFRADYETMDVYDEYATEFIETLFPAGTDIEQVAAHDENVFMINERYYNFDTMEADGGFIHFEFKNY